MYFTYIFLCVLTATAHAHTTDSERNTLPLNTLATDFGSILSNIYDIFQILTTDNFTDIESTLSAEVPADAYLNISQLATKYGYPFEEHTVVTEDGYILNIHRIPYGKTKAKYNGPILLMHGILDSSDSWIIQGPNKALAYILADEGFDVWMGNARGNKHATLHLKYNSSQPEFWKFTWEEIGIYDIPKTVDYILDVTKQSSIYYIGHSQGTTTFYVMNSMKPKYNVKIRMMFSLAPVAWMTHVKTPLVQMMSPTYSALSDYLADLNVNMPSMTYFNKVSAYVCSVVGIKCDNFLQMIAGTSYKSIKGPMMSIMLGHMFSGSSTLQFVHYGQLAQSQRFCRYDFGPKVNSLRYGMPEPPDYNLRNIVTPVGLFYGGEDMLSDPYDVDILRRNLPNVILNEYLSDYNHLDYLYAADNKERIFYKIIRTIFDFERSRGHSRK